MVISVIGLPTLSGASLTHYAASIPALRLAGVDAVVLVRHVELLETPSEDFSKNARAWRHPGR